MRDVIQWARAHHMHVVSDEIYANAVYDGPAFVSAANVCAALSADSPALSACSPVSAYSPAYSPDSAESGDSGDSVVAVDGAGSAAVSAAVSAAAAYLGSDVHVLWGLSKDWAASGLRVGVLFTHNDAIRRAFDNIGYFFAVSNFTQARGGIGGGRGGGGDG